MAVSSGWDGHSLALAIGKKNGDSVEALLSKAN
jgi:hypothetical protein